MSGRTTKRRRVTIACNRCRSQKLRCDGAQPECGRCIGRHSRCEYPKKFVRANVSEEYVRSLELSLKRVRQKCGFPPDEPSLPLPSGNPGAPDEEGALSGAASAVHLDTQDGAEEEDTYETAATPQDDASGKYKSQSVSDADDQAAPCEHRESCGPCMQTTSANSHDGEHSYSVNSAKHASPDRSYGKETKAESDDESDSYPTLSLMGLVDVALFIDRAEKAATRLEASYGAPRPVPHGPGSRSLAERIPCVYRRQWELPSYDTAKKYVQGYFKYEYTLYPFIHQPSFLSTFESYYKSSECCGNETTHMSTRNVAHNKAGGTQEGPVPPTQMLKGSKLSDLPVALCQTARERGFYELSSTIQRQCVLDANTFFIIISLVLALGYLHLSESTEESSVAEAFYTRAESFHHADAAAPNNVSLLGLQASLLEARYLQTTHQYKKCLNVVVKSVGTAYELGINSEPSVGARANVSERNLCRRLWYGCLMMDRSISLILNMPMLISWNYRRVAPRILENEYVNDRTEPESTCPESLSMLIYYKQTVKLYKVLADALRLMCYQNVPSDSPGSFRMSAVLAKLLDFDERLGVFRRELPPFLRAEELWESDDNCLMANKQAAILQVRYLHVVMILGLPILLPRCDQNCLHDYESHWNYTLANNILRCCIDASSKLIGILWRASGLDLLPSMWNTRFYVYTAAILILAAMLRQQLCETGIEYSSLDELWMKASCLLEKINAEAGSVEVGLLPLRSVHQKIATHSATLDDLLALEFLPQGSKEIWGFDISCLSTLISKNCTCR